MGYKREPITIVDSLKTIRLSPSSLNTFNGCPKRWYYEYVEARQTPQTIHLIRGNIVHKALEDIFKKRFYPSGESFRKTFETTALSGFEKHWKEDFKDFEFKEDEEERFYTESKLMIERFVKRYCDNIQDGIKSKKFSSESQGYYFTKPTFKELWIDDEFKINFNEKWKKVWNKDEEKIPLDDSLHVGGFIDSVQKDFDQNLILVDYKTSSKYQNVLSDDYVTQLSIYAYLWWKQTGKFPKFVAINYLKYDESYYILVTPSLVNEAIIKIKTMRQCLIDNGLEEKNYNCKESKLCDWCPFQKECTEKKNE